MEDHYATLRVRPGASRGEIERAYRRLARAYHPDLLGDVSPEARDRAETRLKHVNAAYHVLVDAQRRLAYDRERAARLSRATLARRSPAGQPAPVRTTEHWWGGGPLRVEWATPPPVTPQRPRTELFSLRSLLWGALLIVLFALVLALLWQPTARVAPAVPLLTPTPLR